MLARSLRADLSRVEQALLGKQGGVFTTSGEGFCRMWEFYLVLCQTAFEVGHLAVHHWQLFKGDQPEIPVTRDYLHGC